MHSLVDRLKSHARSLGFAACGLTSPEPPPHLAAYEAWLAAGRHGQMKYLETERARQRRADPKQILPACKTILVAALPYPPPARAGDTGGETRAAGPIAAYARGEDYHAVIPRKLRDLMAWLENEVGQAIEHKIYTDTGPLLEREFAQRAGLGWIGKNTMLIHPQAGSYFLLGEVLMDLELPPDLPFTADHCGTCTRCLEACPTNAIHVDRSLDARHCISYLTIELKGPIPEPLREPMGSWVFGCDICQAVCPWNVRFAERLVPEPAFAPGADDVSSDLASELCLTPEEFNAKYQGSPLQRPKRRGYLRNIAVALGNSGDTSNLPLLEQCLNSERDPVVREHVEWALKKLRASSAGC